MPSNNNVGMTSLNKTRSTEWMLACLIIGWGVSVLQTNDSFQAPAYFYLRALVRESLWGTVAISIGCLRMVGLAINGFWTRSPLIRAAGSWISGLFWLTVGVLMIAASRKAGATLPVGIVFYAIYFAFEGWCLAAAGYDIRKNGSLGGIRG